MFHRIINSIIIINLCVFSWGLFDHEHHHTIEILHDIFLGIFLVEIGYRWYRGDRGGWLYFDTTVILISLMPILGIDAALLRIANTARFAHAMRHVEHLRLFDVLRTSKGVNAAALVLVRFGRVKTHRP